MYFSKSKSASLDCHIFSRSTDPEKVIVVLEWQQPKDKQGVRSFLDLCSYYTRLVNDFGKNAKLLHYVSEKKTPFNWTPDCKQAFNTLKKCLITDPILAYPRNEGLLIPYTDASQNNIRAALSPN